MLDTEPRLMGMVGSKMCRGEEREPENTVGWAGIWKNNPCTKLVDVEDELGQLADRVGG